MTEIDFHIVKKIRQNVRECAEQGAMQYSSEHVWHELSWAQMGAQIDSVSFALIRAGIQVQDKVGIMASNTPRWTIIDLAAMQVRGIVVPIYPTSPVSQAAYITNNADIKIMFVNGQEQLNMMVELFSTLPILERIVVMGDDLELPDVDYVQTWQAFIEMGQSLTQASLDERLDSLQREDLFTLIYTSGTTGEPKGVMLNHHNLNAQLVGHDQKVNTTSDDVSLCFLPLSHVFERAWSLYVLYKGAKNCYLHDVRAVRDALEQVAPNVMCAVPRFYEKIYSAIHDKVSQSSWIKRHLFRWAVRVGKQVSSAKQQQRNPSAWLALNYALADRLVLKKLRNLLGGRMRLMPCGGAKLEAEVGRFFHAIGINVKLGYGMTETTATISCWPDNTFDAESIGDVMPNVDVKIGADNEILVKGSIVMQGYYKLPDATKQAFDEQGYFKTGDVGHLGDDGTLFITDRLKELMKTSGGKYIAPQRIEGKLGQDHFIEQVAVIADTRKFVSALIVPCYDSLENYAKSLNIRYHDRLDLLKHHKIIELFDQRLEQLQTELAGFERVKRFTLLPKEFSLDLGELTPTLKLRRKVIQHHYATEINAMYH